MKNTEQKIPALRFPEFSGDWEEKRLGEIGEIVGGGTPSTTNAEYWDGNIDWFTPSEIKQKYIFKSERKISEQGLKASSAKLLPQGTLLMTTRATIGEVSIALKECCTNQGFQSIITNKDNSNEFVYYLINNNTPIFYKKANGSTFLEISKGEVEKLKVSIPSLPEQQKIADFLSAVDKRLQLLKDKKTKLEEYKRGVMQRIFSQELRFTRPDGSAYPDWEEKELGEVSEILRGTSFPKSEITQNGDTKCIHYGELFTEYKELITSVVSRTNLENGVFSKEGDVLMPTSDVTPNGLARASALSIENVLLGGDINIIRIKGNLYYVFLSYFLNYDKYNIMRLVTGTTVKHIYASDIKGLKIPIPHLDEQRQIADFLSAIDNKISLLSKQIQSTEQYKKGLLQQMFV